MSICMCRGAATFPLVLIRYALGPTDDVLRSLVPQLLSTVLVLLREQAREVVKAVVSFARIAVAMCDPELLRPVVPQVCVGGRARRVNSVLCTRNSKEAWLNLHLLLASAFLWPCCSPPPSPQR